ncbi:MAG: hypothetical protein OXE78_02155 [Gammaproteobacteria bacterium]|nr:hypothetical protein [Gammaproteobacteria bacterium]MCY4356369.1 hypothetical protein [Gammaproteobacteria bacterium]
MSLVARHLEAHGMPTLVLGSAIDIIEHCCVPRYVHVDFPLGNPCGKPYDETMQLEIMQEALLFFARAKELNSVLRLPWYWAENEDWRDAYAAVNDSNRQELFEMGELRRRQQEQARTSGKAWLSRIE